VFVTTIAVLPTTAGGTTLTILHFLEHCVIFQNSPVKHHMSPSSFSWLPRGRGPAITMGTVVGVSVGAVLYSHYAQERDKNAMKEGVQRDKERLKLLRKQRKQKEEQERQQTS
jgi:hypothetical protein